jgi:TetR/AcrR family transcriptional repressor of lmrAB and yxaGH operons
LRAGVQQFQANGYHGTGVAAIISEARAPKGCFYHHFPAGKEQLAVAAVEWLASEVEAFLERLDRAGADGAAMTAGLAAYAAKGLARPERMRGSLITVLAAEAVPASPIIQRALKIAVDRWAAKLSTGFARTGAAAPDRCARAALALVEGATIMGRISGDATNVVDIVASSISHSPFETTLIRSKRKGSARIR